MGWFHKSVKHLCAVIILHNNVCYSLSIYSKFLQTYVSTFLVVLSVMKCSHFRLMRNIAVDEPGTRPASLLNYHEHIKNGIAQIDLTEVQKKRYIGKYVQELTGRQPRPTKRRYYGEVVLNFVYIGVRLIGAVENKESIKTSAMLSNWEGSKYTMSSPGSPIIQVVVGDNNSLATTFHIDQKTTLEQNIEHCPYKWVCRSDFHDLTDLAKHLNALSHLRLCTERSAGTCDVFVFSWISSSCRCNPCTKQSYNEKRQYRMPKKKMIVKLNARSDRLYS